jgi:hypothetical protein
MSGFTMRAASALVALSAAVFFAAPSPTAAQTATFDFEGEATTSGGAHTSLMQSDSGVTMTLTRPGSSFDINSIGIGAFGSRSLGPFVSTGATPFIADFSTLLTAVTIDMGDFSPSDIDTLKLEAFSGLGATGALLDSAMLGLPNTSGFDLLTVAVVSPGIRSVRFIGGSGSFPNSVYYDNIHVRTATDTSLVPEPSSLALLLGGVLPVLRRRRQRQIARTE